MGMITVQVWDATGSKRQDVELPDGAPVNRVLQRVAAKWAEEHQASLPVDSADLWTEPTQTG